jgi:hypothetical protein
MLLVGVDRVDFLSGRFRKNPVAKLLPFFGNRQRRPMGDE